MMNVEYTRRLEKIEAALDRWLPEKTESQWLEKTFHLEEETAPELAASLILPGRALLSRGGKRWRPLLMVLAAESLGAHEEAVLPLSPLVEFPHNASLIHDDIEDNSEERRGGPAIHLLYGNDTAINSGAFLYFLPLACLSAAPLSPALKTKVFDVWGEHMRRLHLGQSMDIAWHRDFHSLPALHEYELMCRLKTGCLARLAAELGVYCAGGSDARGYGRAAENLGVGFQILDDVKNLKTGVPGKKRGDDVVEGKKSLPVLLYLHRRPEQRDFIAGCFQAARAGGVSVPQVEELIGALEKTGVLDEAEKRGLELIDKGRAFFRTGGELLAGFADILS